jgi:hypothetical protein
MGLPEGLMFFAFGPSRPKAKRKSHLCGLCVRVEISIVFPPDKVGIAFGQFHLHPETVQCNKKINLVHPVNPV